jgi:hypothetical protein
MWSLEHDHDSRIRRPQYRRAPGLRRHHFRPGLEGRTVLSSYTAATVSDLIADINASNNGGGSNTITLVAGNTFSLTAVNNTTDGATGLPVIAANDRLTIAGNSNTIDLASGTPAFRLLDVAAGASLTLQNLTLQGGVEVDNGAQAAGGAIYCKGTLDLNGVTVQNNSAKAESWSRSALGGGIYSSGSLTLEGGTIVQNNQAIGAPGVNARPPTRSERVIPPVAADRATGAECMWRPTRPT